MKRTAIQFRLPLLFWIAISVACFFAGKEFEKMATNKNVEHLIQERIDEKSLYTMNDVEKIMSSGVPVGTKLKLIHPGTKLGDLFRQSTKLNRR